MRAGAGLLKGALTGRGGAARAGLVVVAAGRGLWQAMSAISTSQRSSPSVVLCLPRNASNAGSLLLCASCATVRFGNTPRALPPVGLPLNGMRERRYSSSEAMPMTARCDVRASEEAGARNLEYDGIVRVAEGT
jgi:hypothetical protein